jgi:hypothetical protein
VMMYDGVSALGKTDEIAVRDIAELVAASLLPAGAVSASTRTSSQPPRQAPAA